MGSTSWFQKGKKKKKKKNHIWKFFQDNFQNSRGTWEKINKLVNKNPNKNDDIVIINGNGVIICNQKVVLNKFNNYFVNVPQNLLRELGNKFQDCLKDSNTDTFYLKETTPAEAQKLLNNTNIRKASDIYGISPKLVKLSSKYIKKWLSQIFTAPFCEGIVPDRLRSVVIYPIL